MRAVVDDAIHVKVEIVELWDLVLLDELGDERVSLAHRAEEFGNTCRQEHRVREQRWDISQGTEKVLTHGG